MKDKRKEKCVLHLQKYEVKDRINFNASIYLSKNIIAAMVDKMILSERYQAICTYT